jgi:antitoxin CcdA
MGMALLDLFASMTLDAEVLDCAKTLDINVSAVAEDFVAQAAWHKRHGYPLADIMCSPGSARF